MRVELARVALMVAPSGKIEDVQLAKVEARRAEGWFMVVSDADVLPFNAPRLVEDGDGDAA